MCNIGYLQELASIPKRSLEKKLKDVLGNWELLLTYFPDEQLQIQYDRSVLVKNYREAVQCIPINDVLNAIKEMKFDQCNGQDWIDLSIKVNSKYYK
jgi:hypothetical protein